MTPFEPTIIKAPVQTISKTNFSTDIVDLSTKNIAKQSNPIIKMRYGIGKLLKHFSHVKEVK